jgi:chromosome segregation ATPase
MADRTSPSSISTDPDSGYRRGPGRRRPPSGGNGGGGGPRLLGMSLLLALTIAGLAVAGWFIANQHQMLVAEQAERAKAQARIAALEDRLKMTDEAMIDSSGSTKEQINVWESEIRKLWAVVNERNKKWIDDNRKAIGDHARQIANLDASDKTLKGAVGRHEEAFARQSAVIDQLASVELQIQQLVRNQQGFVDKVNSAAQSVAGMNTRVKETEDAIAANDAHRRAINTRIADLERRIAPAAGG